MAFNKRLVMGMAIAASASVLAACGGGGDGEESGGSSGEAADGITIFQSKVEISEQLEAAAEAYTEETGVDVEVIGTTGDDYAQQLQIRLNNGTGPSIFSVQNTEVAERLESYIYDLSNEDMVENIAPDMELTLDDKVVGIPYGVEGFGIVYNKEMVNPEDIQDYDSFVSTLEKFNAEGINGFGLSSEAYFLIGHISNYPFSLQENPEEFMDQLTNGEVTLAETEEFQRFGEFMEAIRANTPTPLNTTYDTQVGDFAAGQTAMIHQGNWASGMLEDFEVDFEVGMAPFPLEGNDQLAVGVGSNWAVNGEKDQAEIDAAIEFLDWLHTSETGQKFIVEDFGFIPAMTNIEAGDLDPLSQAVLEASNSGNTIPWSHNDYPANVVPNDFTPVAESFFVDDSMTGEELVENLEAAWQNAAQ
ncbi:extracellular solute-binding protein [Planococcus sp. CP5-4]|uniref:ABC transporter substrate-binding protein n=1 Tax=unclassified Planococcus (in: firmicutes) TaxID=2662419 RepID=UPI001C25019A|nr:MULTISPECIES: extracellular solute-binding protein [unclassified Planococcus (in: firmicutes)]MBU9674070.1 extracellular solute-binding protein [Planococcus sp. CP5-4_YE]MBV0909941.1 extracellular solute-binding protein [Planococcus sp. CP5-4_UN]MBW6064821.1 extracellular solute-binding protein [Planococcus sp. CP5-4]MDN5708231.1 extracellular solute-binding protein [Planococcus sp. (in: firmicutes)]